MYRAINEQHSAIRRSLSLDQPSGIHFQTSSEMRLRTLFDSHWKHCFTDDISVLSALEILCDSALYKSTFCLLTVLLSLLLFIVGGVAVECRTRDQEVVGLTLGRALRHKNSGQVSHTYVPLSPSSITWYRRKLGSKQARRAIH